MHATYPLLARVCNRELGALSPVNRARVLGVRSDGEQLIGQVVERGARLGVFDPEAGWLGVAAIGGMGIRLAEWFDPSLGVSVDDVADKYADLAARLLTPSSHEIATAYRYAIGQPCPAP